MSDNLVNTTAYYGDIVGKYEQILERHLHHLTRVIRPPVFYIWLRSKGVFSSEDQEEVENKFLTTCLKAGHLIDIIKTKGKPGFIAFMEVIEYDYPELFATVMAKEARQPPPGYHRMTTLRPKASIRDPRRSDNKSCEMLQMIGKLTYTLTKELAEKKDKFAELQELIDKLQGERKQENEEYQSVCSDFQVAQENIEELNLDKERLSSQLSKVKEERDELTEQSRRLREQKDSFMAECTQLRLKLEEMNGEVQRNRSCRPAELDKYKREVERIQSVLGDDGKRHSTGSNELTSLKVELAEWEKKEQLWRIEKDSLTNKVSELESKCQLSQQTNDMCLINIDQVKLERDQALKQLQELNATHCEALAKNDQLAAECREYVEKFRRMEETMQNLYGEIDQMKLTSFESNRGRFEHQQLRMHNLKSDDDDDRSPECPSKRELCDAVPLPTSVAAESRATRSASNPALIKMRRNASYTLGTSPFVVFPVPEIRDKLIDSLTPFYASCPYVSGPASTQTKQDVIHERHSADGSTCLRLTLDAVKHSMAEESKPMLMTVPLTSVERLLNFGIRPTIVVIKLKVKDGWSEVTEEEDALMEMKVNCETLELDSQLVNDFPRLVEKVRMFLDKLKPVDPTS